jgi:Protein of unknown function (DUF3224)
MTTHASGRFKVASWEEDSYAETRDGGKLTRADVKQTFSGDIEGEGAVQWLMAYRADETAHFVGLQRVAGRLGDRSGEFLLETSGTFDGKTAEGEWNVIPGSGTEELRGLRGKGGFSAPLGPEASVTLEYELD